MIAPLRHALSFVAATCLTTASAFAVDFYKDVFPFLENNCIACHNKTTAKGGLNMESPAEIRKTGDSGPGVIPGKSSESPVVQAALHKDDAIMPPKNNKSGARDLSTAEIKVLAAWIDEGAKDSIKPSREIVWKPLPAGTAPIYAVAVSPDGRDALCARGNRLFAYDTATRLPAKAPSDPNAGTPNAAHRSSIHSIAFSPDGHSLITTSFREIKLWRRDTLPTTPIAQPDSAPRTPSYSSSHDVFVKADNTPTLLSTSSPQKERAIGTPLAAKPIAIVPAPDDSHIAFLLESGEIEVRNIDSGASVHQRKTGSSQDLLSWTGDSSALITADPSGNVTIQPIKGMPASSPLTFPVTGGVHDIKPLQGNAFAILAKDQTLRLHATQKVEPNTSIKTPNAVGLCVSADGARAALAIDSGKIRIIELPSGTLLAELGGDSETTASIESLERDIARAALEVAFQKSVVTKLENEVKDLDNHTKRTTDLIATARKTLPEREKAVPPAKEAFTAAEKELADVEMAIKAAPDGKPDAALTTKRRDALNKIDTTKKAFISAETLVANSHNQVKDGEAHIARMEEARKRNAENAKNAKEVIQKSETAQTEATNQIAKIKEASGKAQPTASLMAFGAANATVHAVDKDGRIRSWAISSSRPIGLLKPQKTVSPIALRVIDDQVRCTLADGSELRSIRPSDWRLERTIGNITGTSPFSGRVNCARFSPDGKLIATGSGDPSRSGDVHIWNASTGQQVAAWKERHRDAVLAVDFSPDGKWLVSGGADRLAKVTEVSSGKHVYLLEAHTHQVTAAAFRVDGRVVATGGADGVVNVWDMALGERKKKLTSWKKEITSLQFLGSTNQILTSSGDNQVRIIGDDASEVRSITNLPDFVQAAAATSPTGTIIAGGEDSALRLWDAASGKELALFQPNPSITPKKP